MWLRANGSASAPDLVWLALDDGYAVWSDAGARFQRIAVDRRSIRQAIARLIEAASDPRGPVADLRREGRFLFNRLLLPCGLAATYGRPFTVLPDGELTELPFDLLVDSGGQWLADRGGAIVAAHPFQGEPALPRHVLVVGDPETREALPPLPESRLESEMVAAHFAGSKILLGRDATPESVTAGLPEAELFHYSGHGFAAGGTVGLYLAGQAMTPVLIRNISLGRCQLAVLSACSTAMDPTTGSRRTLSLVRALLDAGARTVVATRWQVDSSAGLALMTGFYERLRSSGDAAASLRGASRAVRADVRFAHPFYWAAYQIYR